MARRRWKVTVAAIVGAYVAVSAAPSAGRADPPRFAGAITSCSDTVGSVVAVDFAGTDVAPYGVEDDWGGPVALGCDLSHPAHGSDLLADTGFTTAGDQHDGPEFICRIGSPLIADGTQYPTPEQDPCIVTPPATAYWSYWLAPAGQDTWTYSPLGAYSDVPQTGEVEAWTFGATTVAGTTGQPSFTPDDVRAQEVTTPPGTGTGTGGSGGGSGGGSSGAGSGSGTGSWGSGGGTTPVTTGTTPVSPPTPGAHGQTAHAADLAAAAHYLVTTRGADGLTDGTSLARDGYYESAPRFADFGLTIDGAFALAAARSQTAVLRRVVAFIADGRRDGSHRSINSWTEIGTPYAAGGSIGKEALLAEVVGANPRHFAGHDLIGALGGLLCRRTVKPACAGGTGSFRYGASTFDQTLAIMAELRAGDRTAAAPAIAYLERRQHRSGAWPSLIPSTGDSDVDSTAMAVMTLALVHGAAAAADVRRAQAWVVHRQEHDGGFPGAAGDSTNSTALAIQALALAGTRDATTLARARAFLAAEQNSDGGFAIADSGSQVSDVRASTQVLGGLIGTSFGTLRVSAAAG